MKIPLLNIEIKRATKAVTTKTRINEDNFNKLFYELTKYFSKGSLMWNKNDLKNVIEEGYLYNPDVYSIINKIVQTASMIDWKLYEVKDTKEFRNYKTYRSKSMIEEATYYRSKSLEEVEQSQIQKLLDYPNDYQTATTFTQTLLGYYCFRIFKH